LLLAFAFILVLLVLTLEVDDDDRKLALWVLGAKEHAGTAQRTRALTAGSSRVLLSRNEEKDFMVDRWIGGWIQ
jgi:hypothetical protein